MSEAQGGQSKFGVLSQVIARNMEDIADLPEFVVPQPGAYKLLIGPVEQKELGNKPAITVGYTIVDIIALNQPLEEGEVPVKAGDKFGEAFFFNDPEKLEQTLSVLKAKYGKLGEALGTTNLLEIMEKMDGMLAQGIVTNRMDKNDKTKIYPGTKDLIPSV